MLDGEDSEVVVEETDKGSIVLSSILLTIYNICPFIFLWVLTVNQANLHKPIIIEKIGTLYNGFNATKPLV